MLDSIYAHLYFGVDIYYVGRDDNWLVKPSEVLQEDWEEDIVYALEGYLISKDHKAITHYHGAPDKRTICLMYRFLFAQFDKLEEINAADMDDEEGRDVIIDALKLFNAPEEIYKQIGWKLAVCIED
jgi:hypothetical protein